MPATFVLCNVSCSFSSQLLLLVALSFGKSLFLFPLPFITFYMMRQLRKRFAIPGTRLSLERAMDIDVSAVDPSRYFDQNAYRQPILAETATCPLPYRRNSGSRARASFDFNPSDVKAESISEESDDDVSEKIRGQKGHEAMMGLSSF